ncbi:hypothetical protein NPIL_656991 [Nephila pilipes]|uniref:Uncharacterized protein n=1 Tax=Nephila pilipes TaxID=299642 RepID=A0A8X6ULS9_NEPPI|nr:hypothetical protein NPIL_656991 [Nephila pilipes]
MNRRGAQMIRRYLCKGNDISISPGQENICDLPNPTESRHDEKSEYSRDASHRRTTSAKNDECDPNLSNQYTLHCQRGDSRTPPDIFQYR